MGNTHMFAIGVEPEFDGVVKLADKVAKECGMSRSVVMRTALHDYFGIPTWNPESFQERVSAIKRKLNKR
jgi:predicted transcriptional regulator